MSPARPARRRAVLRLAIPIALLLLAGAALSIA
jgi:hypothetical protein